MRGLPVKAWLVSLVALALLLAGCSDGAPVANGVPISADAPLDFDDDVDAPTEPQEDPVGRVVFVVDGETNSVYLFDVGRGRILGPAPRRVEVDLKPHALPGYPYVVGTSPPGGAVRHAGMLVVAGGDEGKLALFQIQGAGLRVADPIILPEHQVAVADGSKESSGRPFVIHVAPLGQDQVIALAHDTRHSTTVAYAVDIDTRQVQAIRELPYGSPLAVTSAGDRALVTLSEGILAVVKHGLVLERTTRIPRSATMISVSGQTVHLGVNQPARLMDLDLKTGRLHERFRAGSPLSGPILPGDSALWWALPSEGRLLSISPSGEILKEIRTCGGLKHLVAPGGTLIATCLGDASLVWIDPEQGSVRRVGRVGSPAALVVGSAPS